MHAATENITPRCTRDHPCFGRTANTARIHIPIAAACNISCNFCERSINGQENRPGVTAVLTETQALDLVRRALDVCPSVKVIGVAGPGDALCTPSALRFFGKAKEEFPDLIRCMSTNGLLLAERMDNVLEAGIQTLTVTVNSIVPATQAQICSWIAYHGERLEGTEAASVLIERQLEGIRMACDAGIVVKVNTVLVPGINDAEIEVLAKTMAGLGVYRYNIIPLIPCFKFSDCTAPDCTDLSKAREIAREHIDVFCHCQHCRADAIGVPGKTDFAGDLYREMGIGRDEHFSHG